MTPVTQWCNDELFQPQSLSFLQAWILITRGHGPTQVWAWSPWKHLLTLCFGTPRCVCWKMIDWMSFPCHAWLTHGNCEPSSRSRRENRADIAPLVPPSPSPQFIILRFYFIRLQKRRSSGGWSSDAEQRRLKSLALERFFWVTGPLCCSRWWVFYHSEVCGRAPCIPLENCYPFVSRSIKEPLEKSGGGVSSGVASGKEKDVCKEALENNKRHWMPGQRDNKYGDKSILQAPSE